MTSHHDKDRESGRNAGVQTWLLGERPLLALVAVAAVIGLGFAVFVLGWRGITGTSEYWRTTHNDSLQGIAALRYYWHEPWSWRVLEVHGYGAPAGTNLILADSIPLLALPAKAVAGLLPAGFQYFGYWAAACFVLQPVLIVALLAVLGLRDYLTAAVASVLGLLQTVLLIRYIHVALLAQFVIVLAVLLGVRLLRSERPGAVLLVMIGLLLLVFLVHPYLYAMVLVIELGFVIQGRVSRRLGWRPLGLWIGSVCLVTAGLITVSGLAAAGSFEAGGFDTYSMNLLSLVIPNLDATGGQYEGAAYLGLGVLTLVVVALATTAGTLRRVLRRYWVPLAAVVLLAVYALSTSVWVGEGVHLDLPLVFPANLLAPRFRSPGRFVWPLVYVVIAGAVVLVHRRFQPRVLVPLLVAAVLLQIGDLGTAVWDVRATLHGSEAQYLPAEAWLNAIEHHQLVSAPAHECLAGSGVTSLASRELQRLAARADVPITAAAVARQEADCDDPLPTTPLAPGELRVVWDLLDSEYSVAGADCVSFDLGTVCTGDAGTSDLVDRLGDL